MKNLFRSIISHELRRALRFDLLRFKVRIRNLFRRNLTAGSDCLHLGCGRRRIPGWLNVDIVASDLNIDFACPLPWRDGQFAVVVSQHVIEHLELHRELLPLLRELHRVCKPGAELWLSTPDLAYVCGSYQSSQGAELVTDRINRLPHWEGKMKDIPPSHMINHLFHQLGEHKNLLDFDLLAWALGKSGFTDCRRVDAEMFLQRFPAFPPRNDPHALYILARKPAESL